MVLQSNLYCRYTVLQWNILSLHGATVEYTVLHGATVEYTVLHGATVEYTVLQWNILSLQWNHMMIQSNHMMLYVDTMEYRNE
jgi:hypothetical protein